MGNRGAGPGNGFDIERKFILKLKTFLIINFQFSHRVLNSSLNLNDLVLSVSNKQMELIVHHLDVHKKEIFLFKEQS